MLVWVARCRWDKATKPLKIEEFSWKFYITQHKKISNSRFLSQHCRTGLARCSSRKMKKKVYFYTISICAAQMKAEKIALHCDTLNSQFHVGWLMEFSAEKKRVFSCAICDSSSSWVKGGDAVKNSELHSWFRFHLTHDDRERPCTNRKRKLALLWLPEVYLPCAIPVRSAFSVQLLRAHVEHRAIISISNTNFHS